MFASLRSISTIFFLASHAVSGLENGLRSARKLNCDEASFASCEYDNHRCNEINGHAYWTVHSWDGSKCSSECVADRDLEFLFNTGHKCGPCPLCSLEDYCHDKHSDKIKYHMFKMKDNNKCEPKCIDAEKVGKHLKDDEYTCGRCPVIEVEPKSIESKLIDCPEESDEEESDSEDADAEDARRRKLLCGKSSPDNVPNGHGPPPPRPTKCVMKRSKELMQYWPNYPAQYKDAYIQIRVIGTDTAYNFTEGFDTQDLQAGFFPFSHDSVFQTLYDAQYGDGIELQFVSYKRGPGGWNTCKYSPIAFDLNGDGKVEKIKHNVEIDITGDGDIEKLSEWFGPKEGILIDMKQKQNDKLNNNELKDLQDDLENGIVSGHHLMGDMGSQYTDGFAKLAEYDEDGNGYVDGKELKGLYLWIDRNSNAQLDKHELEKLKDHGIIGIPIDQHNKNDRLYEAYAKLEDGKKMLVKDLWFNEQDDPDRRRGL